MTGTYTATLYFFQEMSSKILGRRFIFLLLSVNFFPDYLKKKLPLCDTLVLVREASLKRDPAGKLFHET